MGGLSVPVSRLHAFDERAFVVFSRGEQLLGRLQGTMEDLTAVQEKGLTAMGDAVLSQDSKDRLNRAQREIAAVMMQIRARSKS